jgi:hypothetical protein
LLPFIGTFEDVQVEVGVGFVFAFLGNGLRVAERVPPSIGAMPTIPSQLLEWSGKCNYGIAALMFHGQWM